MRKDIIMRPPPAVLVKASINMDDMRLTNCSPSAVDT